MKTWNYIEHNIALSKLIDFFWNPKEDFRETCNVISIIPLIFTNIVNMSFGATCQLLPSALIFAVMLMQ